MILIIYLLVSTHEIDRSPVPEACGIAVIPLAVELNEIPVVVAARYRISLDHHVGDSGKIEQHLAA